MLCLAYFGYSCEGGAEIGKRIRRTVSRSAISKLLYPSIVRPKLDNRCLLCGYHLAVVG